MDARTDFLTAPAPSPRGNDVLAGTGSGEISPSGAQFAGVLNGQMLRLERQSLASSARESADLQVLRLGNMLNVITTDAPLPDLASLADFARAQGLGESAVQALFGASAPGGMGRRQALDLNAGNPAAPLTGAGELVNSGDLQAAMALAMANAKDTPQVNASQTALTLAQASAKDILQVAASQDGMVAIAGQNWLSLRAQSAAAAALSISADTTAKQVLDRESAALSGPADVVIPAPAASELGVNFMDMPAQVPARAPTQPSTLPDTQNLGAPLAHLLVDRAPPGTRIHQPAALEVAATLAAAIQAGLGQAPMQQPTGIGEPAVRLTSLAIEKSGSNIAADPVETGAVALAAAKALVPLNATASAAPVEDEAQASAEAQATLQVRLLPPDQAITQRLAQMAGKSKPIDWSALLAGQKVSDTLTALAQSAAPGLGDAQAKLVAQMQANGQLPASGDEARNALLAKLQSQAARLDTAPARIDAATGKQVAPSLPLAPVPTASVVPQFTGQTVGAANGLPSGTKALATASTSHLQISEAAPALWPMRTSSLWETLRIEVPSGSLLEALQEHQAQKSDAEPSLPVSASAGATNGVAQFPAADKAPAASPQAQSEQRLALYQQVADQLGEAMARRLIAQIERGQWKMQLRMQPAALGRIDVELDMHAKGLDATFTSDNAITRELMAQGATRLRETLTQTGTTVASVVVNGDSGRQPGGNSTPGQKPKGEQNANRKKGVNEALVHTAAMPAAAQGDGLNLLA